LWHSWTPEVKVPTHIKWRVLWQCVQLKMYTYCWIFYRACTPNIPVTDSCVACSRCRIRTPVTDSRVACSRCRIRKSVTDSRVACSRYLTYLVLTCRKTPINQSRCHIRTPIIDSCVPCSRCRIRTHTCNRFMCNLFPLSYTHTCNRFTCSLFPLSYAHLRLRFSDCSVNTLPHT